MYGEGYDSTKVQDLLSKINKIKVVETDPTTFNRTRDKEAPVFGLEVETSTKFSFNIPLIHDCGGSTGAIQEMFRYGCIRSAKSSSG